MTILGMKPLDALNSVFVAGIVGAMAWRGYKERREYWTRGSWIGFGITLLLGFALVGFSLYFSAAVGEPWTGARGSNTRAAWIVASLFAMVGGALLVALPVAWLAQGEPSKPFPIFGTRRRGELDAGPVHRQGQKVMPTAAVMNVDHEGP